VKRCNKARKTKGKNMKTENKAFNEIEDSDKFVIDNLVRRYAVRDILDYISSALCDIPDEIGYEEDERTMLDDAAIVAHAAKHVKG
jgi:hypothetical protein